MALCPDLIDPPQRAALEKQWAVWGDDRDAYKVCQGLNKAKADTINALLNR